MNTNDPVTRSFSLHQKILLQINRLSDSYYGHLAEYISSLTWYHNGTEILNNERMNISHHGTSLTISDMVDSDAGTYEVKISSINYNNSTSSATCDRNVLRLLEQTALHAPVTFYLQQYHIPQYKPEDIIEQYFLPMNSLANSNNNITIHYTTDINATFIFGGHPGPTGNLFRRNGVLPLYTVRISYGNEINISYFLRYKSADEIVGNYVFFQLSHTLSHYYVLENCHDYDDYVEYSLNYFAVVVHYWSLNISKIKNALV